MKTRSLILREWEVLAVREGRKSQLRRPATGNPGEIIASGEGGWLALRTASPVLGSGPFWTSIRCPFGQPGDQLAVKEAIRWSLEHDNFYFAADNKGVGNKRYALLRERAKSVSASSMPLSCSRLTLEVLRVWAERVQEISSDDAKAEGCGYYVGRHGIVSDNELASEPGYWHGMAGYRQALEHRWKFYSGFGNRYPFEEDPWVFGCEFKVVEADSK